MENLLNELRQQALQSETRRHFLHTCSTGLGAFALQFLLGGCGTKETKGRQAAAAAPTAPGDPMTPRPAQFVPKAKRVIY
ncbi:MAG: sulfatase, partial [Cytophagales bacterium]|nr:sulfatase [Cytophagales bacterium]